MGCGGSSGKNVKEGYPTGYQSFKIPEKPLEVTEDTLEEFLALERAITSYEKRHLVETLQVRTEQLKTLNTTLVKMEDEYRALEQSTTQGEWDPRSNQNKNVKSFLMEQDIQDENAAFETAENLAALNKKEILRKEIEGSVAHLNELKEEVSALAEDVHDLQTLYQREDELLAGIFGGEYGSAEENRLEQELDSIEVQKQQIESANFKWKQAEVMVEFATKQLGSAVDKWGNLTKLPLSQLESRYNFAEETRNNLIAATQNLQGAQRYLPNIKFPYCNEEEVEMLSQATSYVFTDMQSLERQMHALEVYNVTYRRAAALMQWFDEVINNIISKDLTAINATARDKSNQLRRERIQLIRKKLLERGKDVEIDGDFNIDTENDEADLFLNQVPELQKKKDFRDSKDFRLPSPLPHNELAPPPTKQQLFGDVEIIKAEHEEVMDRYNQDQNVNKARVQQDLQAKLRERRLRRARQKIQSQEIGDISNRENDMNPMKSRMP